MLQASESETEILLGNKQLAGIFLVVAVLLGVAFTGGYMVGREGVGKKPVAAASADTVSDSDAAKPGAAIPLPAGRESGAQTHTVGADDAVGGVAQDEPAPAEKTAPLGARGKKPVAPLVTAAEKASVDTERAAPPSAGDGYAPKAGTRYLQVAAVGRDEAEAVADVLHKKGFRAHAVPKPGSAKLYRVIIGPVRDAGDLSSTRDALRKTGFREVIVQNY